MSDFHQTEMDVIRWAEVTGRLQASPRLQASFAFDTAEELDHAIVTGEPISEISDAVGRLAIDLILLCVILDADLSKCLERAFARVSAKPEKSNVVFLKQE